MLPCGVVPEPDNVNEVAGSCMFWSFPALATGGSGGVTSSFLQPNNKTKQKANKAAVFKLFMADPGLGLVTC